MAKDSGKAAIALGIGIGGIITVGTVYLLTRKKEEIPLSAGWNEVFYTGKRQTADEAFASIMDYLEIAYDYDMDLGWVQITHDTILEPGMIIYLRVSQDCVWRF